MRRLKIRKSIQFGMISVLIYLIFSTIAMLFYSGGDWFNPTLSHYNFFGSFLSDLGRMHGFSGSPTYATAVFYAVGLISMGIGTIVFFKTHHYLLSDTNTTLRFTATIMGIIAGLGYIGIAVTPWDLWPKIHLTFVFTGFLSFMVASMLLFFLIRQQRDYPNTYGVLYLIIGLLIGSYVLMMLYGPSSDQIWGRIVQATGQKIMVYGQSVLIFICGFGALKVSNTKRITNPS